MSALPLYRKVRRKRLRPEACLQMAVVQHLQLTATPGTIYFSIPNEGKRTPAAAHNLKLMGMLPGAADLCLIIPDSCGWNEPHFLELKARGEKQSQDQIAFEAMCVERNVAYAVVDNIDDALEVLRSWGALPANKAVRRAA